MKINSNMPQYLQILINYTSDSLLQSIIIILQSLESITVGKFNEKTNSKVLL